MEQELNRAGLADIHRIDGGSNQKQRSDVIRRFSPYYNESSSAELAAKLSKMPLKVFSGKASPQANARAVFFCHRIPRPDSALVETDSGEPRWSDAAGLTVWACYDLEGKCVLTEPGAIARLIRSEPNTLRHCAIERTSLADLRKKVRLKSVSAK